MWEQGRVHKFVGENNEKGKFIGESLVVVGTKLHDCIGLEMRQFNIMDGKRNHHHHFHYYFDSKNLIMNFPFSNFFSLIWWLTNPKQPERPTKHMNKTEKFSPGFSPAHSLQKKDFIVRYFNFFSSAWEMTLWFMEGGLLHCVQKGFLIKGFYY